MRSISILLTFLLIFMTVNASSNSLSIRHIAREMDIDALDAPEWSTADEVSIDDYWSGQPASKERSFKVRLLWSATALYVRFEAEQHEMLIVSEVPQTKSKVQGLWDRDVCEIFIAPDRHTPSKYFEFEIAPNGEWIDLAIERTAKKRSTDLNYASGMTSATRIGEHQVVMVIKIPFRSLGRSPKAGDTWLGNLFRCIGTGPTRGYLAWRPTKTTKPNFHVPAAFGEFRFVN